MTPQQASQSTKHEDHPASPWTEAYQAMSGQSAQSATEQSTPERPYDNEALAPTHDALSSIYNRGY